MSKRTAVVRLAIGLAASALVALVAHRPARGDPGTVARSTDAVAKERQDEFEDLEKKGTHEAARKRLEILDGLAFAPCPTAQRFLLGLVKKASAPGDERLRALLALLKIADEQAFEDALAALGREKDATLWQGLGEGLADRLSNPVQAWLRGAALESPNADAAGAALEAFARRPDAAQADRIQAYYEKAAKVPARAEAAYRALVALVRTRGAAAKPALLEAARSAPWQIRLAAADLLATLEPFDAESEAAVRALFQDEHPSVQTAAVVQAGLTKRASLAPTLLPMLAAPRARTRHVAATALARMTGQSLGQDAKAWAAYLDKKDPGKPESVTVPTYHGVPVHSDRVVFLVDASSSMTWPWRPQPPHRIDVARSELRSVVRSLPPETLFNVAVFSNKTAWWKKAEAPASPENVGAALAWAEKATAQPAGETHLYEALDAAFATDPQFDTVFLLTDGNPTSGRYWSTGGLVSSVRAWTRFRRAAIHAIGLSLASEDPGRPNLAEDPALMAAVLLGVASASGGEYREVRDAPSAK
jgi:hypothetical protein